ncbi:MAG: hypothetical protein RLY93_20605 [Sumerlaeia bacterium]
MITTDHVVDVINQISRAQATATVLLGLSLGELEDPRDATAALLQLNECAFAAARSHRKRLAALARRGLITWPEAAAIYDRSAAQPIPGHFTKAPPVDHVARAIAELAKVEDEIRTLEERGE